MTLQCKNCSVGQSMLSRFPEKEIDFYRIDD